MSAGKMCRLLSFDPAIHRKAVHVSTRFPVTILQSFDFIRVVDMLKCARRYVSKWVSIMKFDSYSAIDTLDNPIVLRQFSSIRFDFDLLPLSICRFFADSFGTANFGTIDL
jgi:hypothetical protein